MVSVIDSKGKHPDFDEYWSKHRGLVWFMAKKLALVLRTETRDLLGSLTIRFNYVLYYYDPEKGKFSGYYCRACLKYLLQYWMRNESQSWSNFVKEINAGREDFHSAELNFASHEQDLHLYRVPEEDESDIDAVINFFEGAEECWEFMTRKLEQRDKDIISLYFRSSFTLQMIGDKFCISKERVRQLMERAKRHIRSRLQTVTDLANLFYKSEEKE